MAADGTVTETRGRTPGHWIWGSTSTSPRRPRCGLDDAELRAALEAILLVVDTPAPTADLARAVDEDAARVGPLLQQMSADYGVARSGFDLRFAGDGWRFYSRADYAPYVERLLLDGARSKLTRAALATPAA